MLGKTNQISFFFHILKEGKNERKKVITDAKQNSFIHVYMAFGDEHKYTSIITEIHCIKKKEKKSYTQKIMID
jgi:hypothetical protein